MKSARLFYQFFLCFSVLLATSLALDDHDNSQQSQWHTPHYGNKNSDSKNVDDYLSIDFARSNANSPNTLPENGRNVIEDGFSARDAQLARLHGLGPAELSVLSLWKQNTRRGDKEAIEKRFPSRNDLFDLAGEDETITAEDENVVLDNQLAPWSKRSSSKSSKAKENSRKGSSNRDKTSGKKGGEKSTDKNMFSNHKHSATGMDSATASAVDSSDLTQPTQSVAPVVENVGRLNRNLAAQFLLRSPRENRQYDVPIIECPPAEDGMERFACPSPDRMRRYRCIDDHVLCDGFIDCPGAEDEDRQACMFYKTMKAHLDVVADALLRWVRGR